MDDLFSQGHACLVGVGADLPCTVSDAKGIANILTDPNRCGYSTNQVHLLTEAKATRQAIITALETLATTTDEQSTVVIYYSGHGYQLTSPLAKAYYLLPYGYDLNNLPNTAISGSELSDLLRDIPAQKILLLIDCCHAGGLADIAGVQLQKSPLPPEAKRLFAKGGGRMMLGSSSEDELSYAGKPYSAFTTALIKSFCGEGVSKQDGYVRAADLAMYASRIVPDLTGNQQHPVLNIENADNFILGYYAGGEPAPKGLPPELAGGPQIESWPGELNGQSQQSQTIAAGDRAISVSGNVSGATIISGDGNAVGSGNTINNSVTQKGKYNINVETLNGDGIHIGDKY